MKKLLLTGVVYFLLFTQNVFSQSTCQPYPGYRILIVGDSWSQILNENRFISTALSQQGYNDWKEKGDRTAGAGSTAAMWADPAFFSIIREEITQNPGIEVVVLLIGGNDLLAGKFNNGWYVGMPTDQQTAMYNRIESNIRTIISGMKAARPGLQVLICGYDYVNFVNTLSDPLTLLSWDNLGQPTPRQINDAVITLEQRKINIANEDPDVFYVQNLGRMQRKYGYDGFFGPNISPLPGNTPPAYAPFPGGFPDFPTPKQALGGDGTDPIHLNDDGYSEIARQLVSIYFKPKLSPGVNASYKSKGFGNDGFVRPNNTKSTISFRMGKDAAGNYRNIISFGSGGLPDNAVVTKATIFLTRSASTLIGLPKPLDQMTCQLDIKKGNFGSLATLEPVDYSATASAVNVGCFVGPAASNGGKIRIDLNPSALSFINTKGITQFRFYINETISGNVYTSFYDGDATTIGNKPLLEIAYSLPGREGEQTFKVNNEPLPLEEFESIYPNPISTGQLLHIKSASSATYVVRDVMGRSCFSGILNEGVNEISFPKQFTPGMYFVTLLNGESTRSFPLVIAK